LFIVHYFPAIPLLSCFFFLLILLKSAKIWAWCRSLAGRDYLGPLKIFVHGPIKKISLAFTQQKNEYGCPNLSAGPKIITV
jgi:hypothetical protein